MKVSVPLFLLAFLFCAAKGWTYEVIKVEKGGTLQGAVKFKGAPPAPKKILISKDYESCGKGERALSEVSVSQKTSGLLNVVVYLEEVKAGKDWASSPKGYVLDQKGCRFLPLVSIVQKDKKLTLLNSDPVLHTAHAYELIGKVRRDLFNVAQPAKTDKIPVDLKPKKSNLVKVECDAHNFMESYVFIAENPYYALTGEEGTFSIKDIPPGEYAVKLWHPVLGEQTSEVEIFSEKSAEKEFYFEGKK